MTALVPQIGLTGSIGSGKSAVAELFASWGSKIVDADQFARQLLASDSPYAAKLIDYFGPQITRPDGSLDRFALRSIIFRNSEAKSELESMLHPEIRRLMLQNAQKYIAEGTLSVTFVIPLLFESSHPYNNLTHKVVVHASRESCLERASKRDCCPTEIIAKIFDSQTAPSSKIAQADFVIDNNGSLVDLKLNAKVVFDRIHKT